MKYKLINELFYISITQYIHYRVLLFLNLEMV